MRKSVLAIAIAVAAAGLAWSSTAQATVDLSFGIAPGFTGGGFSVNTGNITSLTTQKTIPDDEFVQSVFPADFATGVSAGVIAGAPVTFSTYTFNTVDGADAFTLSVGDLVFTFTDVSGASLSPTTGSVEGSLSEQFNGTVTSDTSGLGFVGQTVSLSESCSQPAGFGSISCSEPLLTPSSTPVPEPSTLALIGAALLGLGLLRRRVSL